jgi:hypothetical protein
MVVVMPSATNNGLILTLDFKDSRDIYANAPAMKKGIPVGIAHQGIPPIVCSHQKIKELTASPKKALRNVSRRSKNGAAK